MHVPIPHLRVWGVLSAFRMADRHALRRRCRRPCCPTCFRGSRRTLPPSPQHCIAAWEMLAQVGLLWILSRLLPPGHAPNDIADALSRGIPPATLGFQPNEVLSVPWTSFPEVPHLSYFPLSSLMEDYVAPPV